MSWLFSCLLPSTRAIVLYIKREREREREREKRKRRRDSITSIATILINNNTILGQHGGQPHFHQWPPSQTAHARHAPQALVRENVWWAYNECAFSLARLSWVFLYGIFCSFLLSLSSFFPGIWIDRNIFSNIVTFSSSFPFICVGLIIQSLWWFSSWALLQLYIPQEKLPSPCIMEAWWCLLMVCIISPMDSHCLWRFGPKTRSYRYTIWNECPENASFPVDEMHRKSC